MIYGFRLRDPSTGAIVFQSSDFSGRYYGAISIPGGVQSGQVALPSMPAGEVWMMPLIFGATAVQQQYMQVSLNQSTRTISYRTDGLPASASIDVHFGLRGGGTTVSAHLGIVIRNPATGDVLFDTAWATMHLAAKGSFSIADPAAGQSTTATVTYSGSVPMIAFKMPDGVSIAVNAAKSGSTVTYSFIREHITQGTVGAATIQYWIYDRLPAGYAPASGARMVLRDPSTGQIFFDARKSPMRISDGGAQPAGKVYAICPMFGERWQEQIDLILDSWGNATGEVSIITERGGWEFSSSTGLFSTGQYQSQEDVGVSGDGSFDPADSVHMVLDVTNH